MKRKIALVLVCLLVFAVALPTLEARADSVWFTVINDTILDLGASTMPTSVGGTVYVPYSVFTNSAFKLYVNYSAGNNLIVFMNANTTLTFDVGIGIAYTQDQTIYKQGAVVRSGVIYVPVNFVCEIFGWSWSSLSTGPCVRIRTTSSGLNDGLFESLYRERLEQKKDAYLGVSQTPAPSTSTSARPTSTGASAAPSPSLAPEPAKYITFTIQGALSDSTMGILDQLEGHNRRVLFFLDTEGLEKRDKEALRLVDQGHTLGLLADPPTGYSQEEMDEFFKALEEQNDALFQTTLQRARLLRFRGGGKALEEAPEEFFDRLAQEGYRLWDYTLAVPGYTTAGRLQALLEERAGVQVLSFEMDGGGLVSLSQALNLLDGQTYYFRVTDETTTPYNVYNELR